MSIGPIRSRHLGKYELQTLLGRGGMAEVWKAFDPQLRRHVAIKIMLTELEQDPEFLVRFEHEARLVALLDHPNIVRIHDFQISQPPESEMPTPYMVMDYVKGQTLSDYIKSTSYKGNIPSWNDIVYLFAITSRALDYAHQKGMVHRDIKPANILLDRRLPTPHIMGEPILTDFGVARMQGTQTGTSLSAMIGTPSYIAPEQALGKHGDRRCDLYSLGIILYEITTGTKPFRSETALATILQHIRELPTSPTLINPAIPPEVSQIILKSIAKQPEDRYNSATEMTVALAQALNIVLPRRSHAGYTPLPDVAPLLIVPSDLMQPGGSYNAGYPTVRAQEQGHPEVMASPPPARPVIAPPSTYTPYFGFVPVGSEQPQRAQDRLPRKSPSHLQLLFPGRRAIIFSVLSLILLLGAGLGVAILQTKHPPPTQVIPVSGQVMFFHSAHAGVGNYDQIQVDMSNVPAPPEGYVYYGWLIGNTLENSPAHWQLTYHNGTVHLGRQSYTGYANLLTAGTLFLVTKESANGSPVVPYTDPQAHLYYAQVLNASHTSFAIKSCSAGKAGNICLS